jgi:hypothetical protein
MCVYLHIKCIDFLMQFFDGHCKCQICGNNHKGVQIFTTDATAGMVWDEQGEL